MCTSYEGVRDIVILGIEGYCYPGDRGILSSWGSRDIVILGIEEYCHPGDRGKLFFAVEFSYKVTIANR